MNKPAIIFIFIFSLFTLSSCKEVLSLILIIDDLAKDQIKIKVENKTNENIKIFTGYSLMHGEYEQETKKVLARSIKEITVKSNTVLYAIGENSGFYYSSKKFTLNGEVWIID